MESKLQQTVYYTEYPESFFYAASDAVALQTTTALVVYRESNTMNGRPFVILRDVFPSEEKANRKKFRKS